MQDNKKLEQIREIENLASHCMNLKATIKNLDDIINIEVDRFLLNHQGDSPELLRANFQLWKDYLLECLPHLDSVTTKCKLATVN